MRPGDDDPVAVATLRHGPAAPPDPDLTTASGKHPRPAMIEAIGLWKEYPVRPGKPPKRVIRGAHLKVGAGRVHCMMGLSGAGKSRIAREAAASLPLAVLLSDI